MVLVQTTLWGEKRFKGSNEQLNNLKNGLNRKKRKVDAFCLHCFLISTEKNLEDKHYKNVREGQVVCNCVTGGCKWTKFEICWRYYPYWRQCGKH